MRLLNRFKQTMKTCDFAAMTNVQVTNYESCSALRGSYTFILVAVLLKGFY